MTTGVTAGGILSKDALQSFFDRLLKPAYVVMIIMNTVVKEQDSIDRCRPKYFNIQVPVGAKPRGRVLDFSLQLQ